MDKVRERKNVTSTDSVKGIIDFANGNESLPFRSDFTLSELRSRVLKELTRVTCGTCRQTFRPVGTYKDFDSFCREHRDNCRISLLLQTRHLYREVLSVVFEGMIKRIEELERRLGIRGK